LEAASSYLGGKTTASVYSQAKQPRQGRDAGFGLPTVVMKQATSSQTAGAVGRRAEDPQDWDKVAYIGRSLNPRSIHPGTSPGPDQLNIEVQKMPDRPTRPKPAANPARAIARAKRKV